MKSSYLPPQNRNQRSHFPLGKGMESWAGVWGKENEAWGQPAQCLGYWGIVRWVCQHLIQTSNSEVLTRQWTPCFVLSSASCCGDGSSLQRQCWGNTAVVFWRAQHTPAQHFPSAPTTQGLTEAPGCACEQVQRQTNREVSPWMSKPCAHL